MHSTTIHQHLANSFSYHALQTLSTTLGIQLAHSAAGTRVDLIEAIIAFCASHGRMAELEAACRRQSTSEAREKPSLASQAERIGQVLEAAPLSYRIAVQRAVAHSSTACVGRDEERTVLDTWLATDTQPYLLLCGPACCGKTALLLEWVASVAEQDTYAVVFVPGSVGDYTAPTYTRLRIFADSLAAVHGKQGQDTTANLTPTQVRVLIADWLRRPLADGRTLLVVLDDLDALFDDGIGRNLFPTEPPAHLRVMVAARQQPHDEPASSLARLGWSSTHIAEHSLHALGPESVSDLLDHLGFPASDQDSSTAAAIARISEGNPLVVRLLTAALLNHSLTSAVLDHMEPGPSSVVRAWLTALREQGRYTPAVAMMLSLCAGALGPLTVIDVQALAPQAFPHRLDFVHAVEVLHEAIMEFQLTAPSDHACLYQRLLGDIAAKRLPARRLRSNPRVVRQKMSKFKLKRPEHYNPPRIYGTFRDTIHLYPHEFALI